MGPPYVAIIENRAEVTGVVMGAIGRDPEHPGFSQVQLRVTRARPIEDLPNLFERDLGSCITLYFPDSMRDRFEASGIVRFVAKKTGLGTAFAVP